MASDFSNSNKLVEYKGSITAQSAKMLLTSTDDEIRLADSIDWHLDGDFTIEVFGVEFTAAFTEARMIVSQDSSAAGGRSWQFQQNTDSVLRWNYSADGTNLETPIDVTHNAVVDTPYDLCVERSGTTLRLYSGGALLGSGTMSSSPANVNVPLQIARFASTTVVHGRIRLKAIRITKGVARYQGAYTVPILPLPTS